MANSPLINLDSLALYDSKIKEYVDSKNKDNVILVKSLIELERVDMRG